jgi:hypothetical protein
MAGKPRKIELAPQTRLVAVEHLAPRFFHEVLECDYEDCLVTDESDLRDFADVFGHREVEVAAMLDRIEAHYLVDGRAAQSTRIIELLEFLQSRGVNG